MNEWQTIGKHLVEVGSATCDISSMLLDADDLRRAGHTRAADKVASAAHAVLLHRLARRRLILERRAENISFLARLRRCLTARF